MTIGGDFRRWWHAIAAIPANPISSIAGNTSGPRWIRKATSTGALIINRWATPDIFDMYQGN